MSDRRGRRLRSNDESMPPSSLRHRYMTRSATRDEYVRSLSQTYWNTRRRINDPQSTVAMSPPLPVSPSMRDYLRRRRSGLRGSAIDATRDRDTSSRTDPEVPSSSGLPRTRSVASRSARVLTTSQPRSGSTTSAPSANDPSSSRVNLRIRRYAAMSTGGRANIYPRPPARHLEANPHRENGPRITASISLHRRGQPSARPVSQSESGTADRRRRTRLLHRILDLQERRRQLTRAVNANDDEFPAVMRSLELVRSNRWDEDANSYRLLHILEETLVAEQRQASATSSTRHRRSNWTNSSRSALTTQQNVRERRRLRTLSNLGEILETVRNNASERARLVERRRPRNAPNRTTDDRTVNLDPLDDNIRIAFEDDPLNQLIQPTLSFSASGDSDASAFVNSVYGDISTDDVFYSESDRAESDSEGSVESASTATPHSLVSLSLNALHPSPTPSLSSTETDANVEEEGVRSSDDEEEPSSERPRIATRYTEDAGNPIIFLHNNISVHLLSSMAELADAFTNFRESLLSLSDNLTPQNVFRGFASPQYSSLEPTQRRVPEGVDCQRAKLIDELNSNTAECIICTDPIRTEEQVWPCNNCFNIFHLPCIRRWAKTNRDTEMGGAWICPVCRRPKFCSPNRLRYRCLCGRLAKPKPIPGVTPHCCGEQCKHNCGLLCHPGPCKMTEAETAAMIKAATSSSSRHQVSGSVSTLPSEPPAVSMEARPSV